MGILNVTPDSFSDGGRFATLEAALAQAEAMAKGGSAIIDVGGESTRPGAAPVSEAEERSRVLPVVDAICQRLDLPVSIDSYKAAVARAAVDLGAAVINDVWGLQKDSAMADAVAETESAVVIMHNRQSADAAIDIMADIRRFFDVSLDLALKAGIPDRHIILDPGIGFGKTFEQSLTCIRELDRLHDYGRPILLGLSRKSVIGRILDKDTEGRLAGTLAANFVGLTKGARILRVHDVEEHHSVMQVLKAAGAI